jgi:hypothetical protein
MGLNEFCFFIKGLFRFKTQYSIIPSFQMVKKKVGVKELKSIKTQ